MLVYNGFGLWNGKIGQDVVHIQYIGYIRLQDRALFIACPAVKSFDQDGTKPQRDWTIRLLPYIVNLEDLCNNFKCAMDSNRPHMVMYQISRLNPV
jgi:hypothetical protein